MRVLLVDDHAIVRRSLRTLLQLEPDIEIAGEASNGREAIDLTRQLQPDVVLMDITMPTMNGIEATRAIHSEFPYVCVIGLSMHARDEQAEVLRDAGAMDYVTKGAEPEELLVVMRGCYARLREDLPPAAGA
jgi:DNA-binding NarL/FixJ family response regulator